MLNGSQPLNDDLFEIAQSKDIPEVLRTLSCPRPIRSEASTYAKSHRESTCHLPNAQNPPYSVLHIPPRPYTAASWLRVALSSVA